MYFFKTNKKQKVVFSNYKTMHIYCKNCKNIQVACFQKKLVLISKNKIKGKSKCAICLSEKTFIHEIEEDKYSLEIELEIYLQFLLIDVIKEHEDLLREV